MFLRSLSYTVDSGQEVEVPQVDRRRHVSPSSSPSPVMRHCVADRLPALDSVSSGLLLVLCFYLVGTAGEKRGSGGGFMIWVQDRGMDV